MLNFLSWLIIFGLAGIGLYCAVWVLYFVSVCVIFIFIGGLKLFSLFFGLFVSEKKEKKTITKKEVDEKFEKSNRAVKISK